MKNLNRPFYPDFLPYVRFTHGYSTYECYIVRIVIFKFVYVLCVHTPNTDELDFLYIRGQ